MFVIFSQPRKPVSPQQSSSDTSGEDEGLQFGSSPSRSVLSESLERSPKRSQRRPKPLVEGGKRRGSTKRVARKQPGSLNMAGNAGDYELTEVVQYEGLSQLPSPFLVWAVQLPFHGSLPRSERGFSLSMWLCLTCPSQRDDVDAGVTLSNSGSFGQVGSAGERINLSKQGRIFHLCSIGSGKSLFEVWTTPSDGCIVVR